MIGLIRRRQREREIRAAVLAALRDWADPDLCSAELAVAAGLGDDVPRVERIAEKLRLDGLVERDGGRWRLSEQALADAFEAAEQQR